MDNVIPFQDRELVVLRSAGKVPMMAGCVQCGRKFFTPSTIERDAYAATAYLEEKFARHTCLVERRADGSASEEYYG
jgi:hypothetical protein